MVKTIRKQVQIDNTKVNISDKDGIPQKIWEKGKSQSLSNMIGLYVNKWKNMSFLFMIDRRIKT